MIKRSLSWLLTAAMLITLFLPVTAAAQPPDYTCVITDTLVEYDTLASALAAVTNSQTIQLLTAITYDSIIMATSKSFTLDVNGYPLTVNVINSTCVYASGGYDIAINDSNTSGYGQGAFTAAASGGTGLCGLYADGEGSSITVNAPAAITTAGTDSRGIYASGGGAVTVANGQITSDTYGIYSTGSGSTVFMTGSVDASELSDGKGVYADDEATVSVTGNVDGRYYGARADNSSDIEVDGNVTGYYFGVYTYEGGTVDVSGDVTTGAGDSAAVYALSGCTVSVDGDVSGGGYGALAFYGGSVTIGGDCTAAGGLDPIYATSAYADGAGNVITITGNASVTGNYGYGVQANNGGSVTVEGNVTVAGDYSYGVQADNGGSVAVKGNVTATGTGSYGALATGADAGSTVTVDGEMDATSYIKVGAVIRNADENTKPTTKTGYLTYTNAASPLHTVWVKEIAVGPEAFAWVAYDGSGSVPEGAAKLKLPVGPLITVSNIDTFYITGADYMDGKLYGVSSDGNSGLYSIDPETGAYELVGQTGIPLQGLTYDTKTETAYATNGEYLYIINLGTGSLTLVGAFGSGIAFMVGIAMDTSGHMYGVDIQTDALYSINTVTGAASLIGGLQFDINYTQDIAYDRDNGILYGALYTNAGGLYTIDTDTGEATLTYDFAAEVAGFAIPHTEAGDEEDLLFRSGFEPGDPGVWSPVSSIWSIVGAPGMTSPTAAPHGGSYAAKFASFGLSSGTTDLLRLMNDLSLPAGRAYTLSFWMYHDTGWAVNNDFINVQISTNGGDSWVNFGPAIYRNDGTSGWKMESISLEAYAGQTIRIGFLGTSQWGNNIYIDDVSVSRSCIIDGCFVGVANGGFDAYTDIGEERYYHVSTAEQLAHIGEHLDLNYIQTADIDLSTYNGGVWKPIGGFGDTSNYCTPGYFTGKYLGNGKKIENLHIQLADSGRNAAYAGIFASVKGTDASISNLTVTVSGVSIDVYNYIYSGTIAGALEGGSITNCSVQFLGDVDNCDTPNGSVGGIVGYSYKAWNSETQQYEDSVIEDCSANFSGGSILADGWSLYAGGIMGRGESTLIGCGVVIGEGEKILAPAVGGLVGMFYAKTTGTAAEDCSVTGGGKIVLSPQEHYSCCAGGLVGQFAEGEILNCTNTVQVDATGITMLNQSKQVYAGGLVGYAGTRATMRGCRNEGDVSLLIANNVVDSYGNPAAPLDEEYAFAGGLVGYLYGYSNKATIENCENDANVSCVNQIPGRRAYAGGLAGHVDSGDGDYAGVNVYNCANLGEDKVVHAEGGSTLAGGLFGSTTFHNFEVPNITLSNSYNRSSVEGVSCTVPDTSGACTGITAGGIIGAAGEVTVSSTYSTAGSISAESDSVLYGADTYEGGIFGILYLTTATLNYCQSNGNVSKAAGGVAQNMDIVAADDLDGSYECATAAQLGTKSFFSGWHWYSGGGEAPDYYTAMDPWRQTEANGYPVLKGKPYTASTGGGGGSVTYYTITAAAGVGGTITPSGSVSVQENSSKTFTIKANDGYVISDVLVDGASVGKVTEYKFTSVSKNHTIEAKFAVPECPSKKFADVDTSLWYHDCIDFVLSHGLFNGVSDTSFGPGLPMTRGMFATVLHRLERSPASGAVNPFGDVENATWYTEAVLWCASKGVVKGNGAGSFSPGGNITREQITVVLYNYAVYKGYDVSAGKDTDLTSFPDCSDISGYALTAMRWAVGAGLMQGRTGNTLDPLGNATRSEVAQILMRFIETYAE